MTQSRANYAQAIRAANEIRSRVFLDPDRPHRLPIMYEYEDRHPYSGAYRIERQYGCPVAHTRS